jgi:hypothetical protein
MTVNADTIFEVRAFDYKGTEARLCSKMDRNGIIHFFCLNMVYFIRIAYSITVLPLDAPKTKKASCFELTENIIMITI